MFCNSKEGVFLFHKWTKWEQRLVDMVRREGDKQIPFQDRRQKRNCERCNFEQDELILKGYKRLN